LKRLWENNIGISVASRTGEIDGAEQLINLFGWNKYFTNKQIYPGSKDTHINRQVHRTWVILLQHKYSYIVNVCFIRISKACKIELEDMIFFDDEHRNIVDLERLGVISVLVKNGMTMKVLMDGLKKFSDKRTFDN